MTISYQKGVFMILNDFKTCEWLTVNGPRTLVGLCNRSALAAIKTRVHGRMTWYRPLYKASYSIFLCASQQDAATWQPKPPMSGKIQNGHMNHLTHNVPTANCVLCTFFVCRLPQIYKQPGLMSPSTGQINVLPPQILIDRGLQRWGMQQQII
jgi:hypothetical protein